ncbi:hypothetical protein LEP1GSC038_0744 [Leptospira weilii str. 2006001855]|uniref:Uncharacterized protein n=1 Tax=Leptospira weilii str. 2006001855 TaxID=996804 RepID=M6FXG4_9LEPT|nr:hypothetical protein LEP1GSC038_0744 [Leptospira weilii str. 2006001855]
MSNSHSSLHNRVSEILQDNKRRLSKLAIYNDLETLFVLKTFE